MKNMKKKIIAMAMAVSLAFATTAFAAEAPVPDFNKVVPAENIYGTYEWYDYENRIVYTADIQFGSGDGVDFINVGSMFMDGGTHYIRNYSGILDKIAGNVYYSEDGYDYLAILVVFGDDAISITFTKDDPEADYSQLNGVYECVKRLDLAHVS